MAADPKHIAEQLEACFEAGMAEKLGEVLEEFGIAGVTVNGISVETEKFKLLKLDETPCPTKCRVLPDGSIICEPVC